MKFLDDFDANQFENVFVKWDSILRNNSHTNIKDYCEQIYKNDLDEDLTKLPEIVK